MHLDEPDKKLNVAYLAILCNT